MGRKETRKANKVKKLALIQDNICYLCGEKITNIDCRSLDHIIPSSIKRNNDVMLTHKICNTIRATDSIIKIMVYFNYLKDNIGTQLFCAIVNCNDEEYKYFRVKYFLSFGDTHHRKLFHK